MIAEFPNSPRDRMTGRPTRTHKTRFIAIIAIAVISHAIDFGKMAVNQ